MEENKKGGIDFLTLLCLAAIVIITLGFFVGAMIKGQSMEAIKEENKVVEEHIENIVEENEKENEEEIAITQEEEPDYNNKIDTDKPYVYTKDTFMIEATEELEYDTYDNLLPCETKLPFINIKDDEISKINDELEEYYKKTKDSFDTDGRAGYSFETLDYNYIIFKDEILSLTIIFGKTYVPSDSQLSSKSFNFDLENGKILTNEQFLERLGLTKENLKEEINEELKPYYDEYKKFYEYGNKDLSFEDYLKTVKYSYANKKFDQRSFSFESDVGEKNFYDNINLADISIENNNNELYLSIDGIYVDEMMDGHGVTVKLSKLLKELEKKLLTNYK